MKKFFKHIDKILLSSSFGAVSLLLAFLWWKFDADYLIPIWILFLVVLICYMLFIIFYAVLSLKQETLIYRLPCVKSICLHDGKIIFLVENNELYGQGAYVTICYQREKDDLETVLALGYVETKNSSGFLQIYVEKLSFEKRANQIMEKLENSDRKAIKIKPTIYKEFLMEVFKDE